MLSSLTHVLERHSDTETAVGGAAVATGGAMIDVLSLRAALAAVPDPLSRRGVRYPFTGLLLVLVCAVFFGAKSLATVVEWVTHAAETSPLFVTGKIPSLATIHRLVAHLDPWPWTPRSTSGPGHRS